MSQQQTPFKISLIGDSCIDLYTYVSVDRLSPEAPVPVCNERYTEAKQGMASNVKANLEALGCVVEAHLGKDSVKERIIDIKSKQQLLRIDNDAKSPSFILSDLDLTGVDAVVISDYNKGLLSTGDIKGIVRKATIMGKPVFIDTKKIDLEEFEGAIVKINELEASLAVSKPSGLIVTRGNKSTLHRGKEYPVAAVEITDVCGAGDTFLAALVYAYLNTDDLGTAITFANRAAAVTVSHMGVYAPTLEEIV